MVRLNLVASSLLSFVWTSQALRRKSRAARGEGAQTTYDGCKCKANSQCDADIGSLFKCDTCRTEGKCGNIGGLGLYRWDYCDYRPSTVESFIERTWSSKMTYFWNKVTYNTSRAPHYPSIVIVAAMSVRTTFDLYKPEMPLGREKAIHAVGSVCKFNLQIGNDSPYTGLLAPGLQTGFIRMGGAVEPGLDAGSGITPGLGFKLPRTGRPDGDFVALYSLAPPSLNWNFFSKNMSNHIEPATGLTAIVAKKFMDASQCPFQVGLSDLARYSRDGAESNPPRFPFKLFMMPGPNVKTGLKGNGLDNMHSEIDAFPEGTTLYKVYACTRPSENEMTPSENLEACGGAVFLGDIVTASQCTTSWYGDHSFHIRHQRIEEDWQLQPMYMKSGSYDAKVACDSRRLDAYGAPPACGEEGMLASDA